MVERKPVRTRGKLQLSRYFQELKSGDFVTVVRERAVQSSFPVRLQGRTGQIQAKKGRAYIVKIQEEGKEKIFLIDAIHLKKIKQIKSQELE